jgi:hypothetical protein
MGIHIDVRIDLTPKQKKLIRAAVVTGSMIGALGVGLAVAAPHQWKSSDPLAAGDLNGLNVVSYTTDAGITTSYSVGATKYCGLTPVTTTGAIVYATVPGYPGAKKACENVAACGSSKTAHMCTAEEMVRSTQLGILTPNVNGWISSGVVGGNTTTDCFGWTNGTISWAGAAWITGASGPVANAVSCNSPSPILCCD